MLPLQLLQNVINLCLGVVFPAVARVSSVEIRTDSKIRAFVGEPITLRCWFKSSVPVTDKLTIDWTYRPPAGGHSESVSDCS